MKKFLSDRFLLAGAALAAPMAMLAEETGGSGSTASSNAETLLTTVQSNITDNLDLIWTPLTAIVGAGVAIWIVIKLIRIIKRGLSSAS